MGDWLAWTKSFHLVPLVPKLRLGNSPVPKLQLLLVPKLRLGNTLDWKFQLPLR